MSNMIQRTALPLVLACAAVSCGAEDDRADGPPPFSSFIPGTAVAPGVPAGAGNGQSNGIANGSGSQGGSEQIQAPGLEGTTPSGSGSIDGQASPGAAGLVPSQGDPSMLDTVIEAEAFNPA